MREDPVKFTNMQFSFDLFRDITIPSLTLRKPHVDF